MSQFRLIAVSLVIMAAAWFASAQEQTWGFIRQSSQLVHEEDVIWKNPSTNGQILRRTFRFPELVDDERFFSPIDAVIVSHHSICPNTIAELSWGGPGENHVGIELESAAGECIRSTVQVFSTPEHK